MKYIYMLLPVALFFFISCNEKPSESANLQTQVALGNSDQFQTDQIKVFYENGTPKFVENIMNGKKHGEYLSYYKTGQKKTEGRYENGKRKGVWRFWNEKGEINYQIDYSSDLSLRF